MTGRPHDERGATAVIVALSLTALMGAAVLSIDSGSVWRTRRELVTNTDAAALAAARSLDAAAAGACNGPAQTAAKADALQIIGANDSRTSMTGFTVTPTSGSCTAISGRVRVDATLPAPLSFSGVFGVSSVNAAATSIAQYGPLTAATGLRPIGICDKSEHFVEWEKHLSGDDSKWGKGPDDSLGPQGQVIHHVDFTKGGTPCGSGTGNWGWLDFNGSATPNGDSALVAWLRDGYPNVISLGDIATGTPADCNPEAAGSQAACDPKTGAEGSSVEGALQYLKDNAVIFPIIVFSKVVDRRDSQGCAKPPPWTGSGDNAEYCLSAFLMVRVWGWDKFTGNGGAFDFEFVDDWWVGSVGQNPSGATPTTHGVALCGGGYGTSIDMHCDA